MESLQKVGSNYYSVKPNMQADIDKVRVPNLKQGFLETSNVNIVNEMTEMIHCIPYSLKKSLSVVCLSVVRAMTARSAVLLYDYLSVRAKRAACERDASEKTFSFSLLKIIFLFNSTQATDSQFQPCFHLT
jgi:hypothetical protein